MSSLPPGLSLAHPAVFIATVGGIGLLPGMPGTYGSLAALPIALGLHALFGTLGVAVAGIVAFVAGIWAATVYGNVAGVDDPPAVVIDELAAQLLVLSLVDPDPILYPAAFLAFRAFDIIKPFPIGWADRNLKGGVGAMVDDLLAAIYAGSLIAMIAFLLSEA